MDHHRRESDATGETADAVAPSTFGSALVHVPDGVVVFDADNTVVEANAAAESLFGVGPGELAGRHVATLVTEDDLDRLRRRADDGAWRSVVGRTPRATGVRPDGTTVPIEVSIGAWTEEGGRRWAAIVRDATEQQRLIDELQHVAFHDRLTGVGNREKLRSALAHSLEVPDLARRGLAVFVVDIDHFKRVNDTKGYDVGDQLLRLVARRLAEPLEPHEVVARIGGNQFALVAGSLTTVEEIEQFGEMIRRRLEEPFVIGRLMLEITVSVGACPFARYDIDAEEAVRNATIAMYTAKEEPHGSVALYDPDLHEQLLSEIELEADLRRAVATGEVEVHYQPLVDMAVDTVVGFEALARWTHPTRGPIPPPVFIELAERSDLILLLGRHVLATAIREAAGWWPEAGISINLSAHQLGDRELVPFVEDCLELDGLDPARLTLEVTESVMVGDGADAVATLLDLKGLGLRLAMDDFGTGYSSLSYLRQLPLDVLKLDRSFVNDMATSVGRSLVEAVAVMADALGMDLVAEGVETRAQRQELLDLGYRRAQGFLYSPAVPAHRTRELLDGQLGTGSDDDASEPAAAAAARTEDPVPHR